MEILVTDEFPAGVCGITQSFGSLLPECRKLHTDGKYAAFSRGQGSTKMVGSESTWDQLHRILKRDYEFVYFTTFFLPLGRHGWLSIAFKDEDGSMQHIALIPIALAINANPQNVDDFDWQHAGIPIAIIPHGVPMDQVIQFLESELDQFK